MNEFSQVCTSSDQYLKSVLESIINNYIPWAAAAAAWAAWAEAACCWAAWAAWADAELLDEAVWLELDDLEWEVVVVDPECELVVPKIKRVKKFLKAPEI